MLMLFTSTTIEVVVDSKVAGVIELAVNRALKSTVTFLLAESTVQEAVKVLTVAVHPILDVTVFSAARVKVK